LPEPSLFGFTQKHLDRLAWRVADRTPAKLISRREARNIAWDSILDYLIGAAHFGNTTPRAGYLMRIGENAIKDQNKQAARQYLRQLRAETYTAVQPDFADDLVGQMYAEEVVAFLNEDDLRLGWLLVEHDGNQSAVARTKGMSPAAVNKQVKALQEKILGKFPDVLGRNCR
jgi:hypothetical protein